MKFRFFRLVAACLALFAFAAPAHATWREARSKHFIVYADMSEGKLRRETERLERFDALLRKLFNVQETVPVSVYILSSVEEVQDLGHNHNAWGFYNASAQLAYAFMPETLPYSIVNMTPESIMRHEYAHHMLLGSTDRTIPGWASEGLAEFFMTATLTDDGSITIGKPNGARSPEMFRLNHWSVKDLITSDDRKISDDELEQKYTRGWAMIDYLWMSGKRPGQYVDFIDRLNKTGDALKSAQEAFGDLDQLDSELNAYLTKSSFPLARFSAEQLNAPRSMTIRELRDGEAAILDYRMQSLLGVDEKTAPKLADKAEPVAANYPNDPFVQRTMAEIEYDAKRYDKSEAAADRALAADPKNLMAMVYKGRLAAQRAMAGDKGATWQDARNWFLRANRVDPNHPLPFELYYDSFVAAGETPPKDAVNGIYRAEVLMPQDLELRARVGVELIRSGDLKLARYVLAPAAFAPHAAQDNPMRKLVEEMAKTSDVPTLLAWVKDQRFDARFNDFLYEQVAKEDEEKAKEKAKQDGKDKDGDKDGKDKGDE